MLLPIFGVKYPIALLMAFPFKLPVIKPPSSFFDLNLNSFDSPPFKRSILNCCPPPFIWICCHSLVPLFTSFISFFAQPTRSTAAIVVSRRCFICLLLLILHPSCRRLCGGDQRSCIRIINGIELRKKDVYFFQWKVSPSRIRLRFDFRLGAGLANFFGAFSARYFLISSYFGCSAKLRHSLGSFCTL